MKARIDKDKHQIIITDPPAKDVPEGLWISWRLPWYKRIFNRDTTLPIASTYMYAGQLVYDLPPSIPKGSVAKVWIVMDGHKHYFA